MTTFVQDAQRTIYQLGFQISPIILVGGVAAAIGGNMLPIMSITESINFVTGLLSGGTDFALDDFFAQFEPYQGATLLDQEIGRYPFANQTVAANAVITQPLRVPMKMIVPARGANGFGKKLAIMTALREALYQHNTLGGTYIVVTTSYIYQNCVMRTMRDITSGESKQKQTEWLLEFEQPLLTLGQAQQAQNGLMSKIDAGLPTDGSLSGPGTTPGNAIGVTSPNVVPASSNLIGASLQGAPASPVLPYTSEPLAPL